MGLYGFKPQFWNMVLEGSKRHTIRCPRRWPDTPGKTMYLYANVRRPDAFLLMEAKCLAVRPIVLEKQFIEVDGVRLQADERDALAWRDGFRPPGSTATRPGASFALMSEFWRGSMLPLTASLNEWAYPPMCYGAYGDLCKLRPAVEVPPSDFRRFLMAHVARWL